MQNNKLAKIVIVIFIMLAFSLSVLLSFDVPKVRAAVTQITLSSPPNNAQTLDTTPDFTFIAVSSVSTTIQATLYIDGVASGTVDATNNTETTITCNHTLSINDAKKQWYINFTDAEGTYQSEIRNIGIGAYFTAPAVLLNPNATSEHWTYYLNASTSNLNVNEAISIVGNNITLNGQGYILDGNDAADKGIRVYRTTSETSNVTIQNITLSDWDTDAIELQNAHGNTLRNITVSSCPIYGIVFWASIENTLDDIIMNAIGQRGLSFTLTRNNIIANSTITGANVGIYLDDGDHNIINNVTLRNNVVGIHVYSSYNNTITFCRIEGSTNYGVYMDQAENVTRNIFYNNLFNNTVNVSWHRTPYTHNWNTTKQSGTRIFSNGTLVGGNFWAKPDGTGPSQTGEDADGDGFLDSPVQVGEYDNYDYLAYSLHAGEILNLFVADSNGVALSDALVTFNNGTLYNSYVTNGWSNWTGQTYGNDVSVSVTFQGVNVNATSIVTNGLITTTTLQCKVYSLTVTVVNIANQPLSNIPLLLYRNGTLINGMYGLPDSPLTNTSGMFTWNQLAYQTASYTIVIPGATSQTITLTENTDITLTIPPPTKPSPVPTPTPPPTKPSPVPTPTPILLGLLAIILVLFAWWKRK